MITGEVPIAGLALLPLWLGLPPLLLPAHVVLTQLVIDPVCSLAFEGAAEDRCVTHPADNGRAGPPGQRKQGHDQPVAEQEQRPTGAQSRARTPCPKAASAT